MRCRCSPFLVTFLNYHCLTGKAAGAGSNKVPQHGMVGKQANHRESPYLSLDMWGTAKCQLFSTIRQLPSAILWFLGSSGLNNVVAMYCRCSLAYLRQRELRWYTHRAMYRILHGSLSWRQLLDGRGLNILDSNSMETLLQRPWKLAQFVVKFCQPEVYFVTAVIYAISYHLYQKKVFQSLPSTPVNSFFRSHETAPTHRRFAWWSASNSAPPWRDTEPENSIWAKKGRPKRGKKVGPTPESKKKRNSNLMWWYLWAITYKANGLYLKWQIENFRPATLTI